MFMYLPDPCVHLLDPCVQHGSAAYAAPFMGLPDACVYLQEPIDLLDPGTYIKYILDPRTLESSS